MPSQRKCDDREFPNHLKELAEVQDSALTLIKTHLMGRLREIEAKGYNRTELAMAYLLLAYHALRHNHPKSKANDAFEYLAYFAKQRIEKNIQQNKLRKISKLH